MVLNVSWEVEGGEEVTRTLSGWGTRLRNPQPAFNEMMDFIAEEQKDWFATKGFGSWAPLSEPYRTWKKKRFPKRGILHGPDTPGHRGLQLRDQLTRRPFGFEIITRNGFELGTRGLPYARAHQVGTSRMPARPPLRPLNTSAARTIEHILQVHVVGETIGRSR